MDFVKEFHKIVRLKMQMSGVKSRMVQTPIATQHVYDIKGRGNLPTVVILHGIGGNSTSFDRMVSILQKYTKRIILPEAPAHGFSELPLSEIDAATIYKGIVSLIESEVDEKPIIFGNSMGGAIALKYAVENPGKALAISLSSPGGALMEEQEWNRFLDRFRLKDTIDAITFINNIMYKPTPMAVLLAHHILSTIGSPEIQELVNNVPVEYLLKPGELESLKLPIQLIWGKADRIMLKEHLEYYKKHLPKHTIIEEPEDFGHCPHIDRPVQLTARVINFMEKVNSDIKSGVLTI